MNGDDEDDEEEEDGQEVRRLIGWLGSMIR